MTRMMKMRRKGHVGGPVGRQDSAAGEVVVAGDKHATEAAGHRENAQAVWTRARHVQDGRRRGVEWSLTSLVRTSAVHQVSRRIRTHSTHLKGQQRKRAAQTVGRASLPSYGRSVDGLSSMILVCRSGLLSQPWRQRHVGDAGEEGMGTEAPGANW